MSDIAGERYKSLLIVNESNDAQVTLYLYPARWLPSFESKIIQPNGGKYLHRSSKRFEFKLVAIKSEDGRRSKKTLQERKDWVEDKLLKITESLDISEGRLKDFPEEKTICLRKAQRDKELKSTSGKRNLYEVLDLDMEQVRKMRKEDQIKAIKKGYQRQMKRWHSDKNFGDDENAKEINLAYEILKDEAKRARYHNEADYGNSWLSLKRFKAIFWPECVTKEQKISYWCRMLMFLLSCGVAIGGIAATVLTAGLAAPAVVLGGVFGGGLLGAGLQSLLHTMSKKSIVDGCDWKQWLIKALIGFVGGAATGGAAVGITAGVAGLGGAAMESAALTMGQYIGIGAGSGAVGGAASSLATDIGRKFADGENVTWKQVLIHAVSGAAAGAAAGAAGGAVTKSVVGIEASAATANLEGEIGEQVVILTGARRLCKILAQRIPRALTENGTEAVMGSVTQLAEERLDDSVENRNPVEHLVDAGQNVAFCTAKGLIVEGGSAMASHAWNEIQVDKRVKRERSQPRTTPSIDDDTSVVRPHVDGESEHVTRERVQREVSEENNEHRSNWKRDSKYLFSYRPLAPEKGEGVTLSTDAKEDGVSGQFDEEIKDKPDCRVKYISKGPLSSKMFVSYFLNGERETREVRGSWKSITIPGNATQLEVKFQVRRLFWGDIKKYDRFNGCWCKPYEPHVFRYNTPPPLRTFTITGTLGWKAVTCVSNEYHDETKDM